MNTIVVGPPFGPAQALKLVGSSALVSLVVVASLCGCESEESRMGWVRGAAETSGDVVAVVDGEAIPASILERGVRRANGDTSKEHLLDELIVASILYEEAEADGYAAGPTMELKRKQLMVQRMLEDLVESRISPEAIPPKEARDYYDDNIKLYYNPDLRKIDHLLVMPNPEKWDTSKGEVAPPEVVALCDEFSAKVRDDILSRGWGTIGGPELRQIKEEWSPKIPATLALHIDLGMVSARKPVGTPGTPYYFGSLDPDFVVVAFELDAGELSKPARTRFGTHLIVVQKIIAEDTTPYAEAEPSIRDFLAERKRRKAVEKLVHELQLKSKPKVDLDSVSRLEPDAG